MKIIMFSGIRMPWRIRNFKWEKDRLSVCYNTLICDVYLFSKLKKKSQVIRKPIVIEILWRIIIVFWDTTSNKNIFNAFVAKNILKLFSINTLVKENSCTLQLWVCFKLIFIVYELYYQLKFYINLYLFEFRKLLLYLSVCEKVYIPPHK